MYLGVPIIGPSILFGDNESIVNTTSRPHGKLHKRPLMLSYHYVREALATGEYVYSFVNNSKKNALDMYSASIGTTKTSILILSSHYYFMAWGNTKSGKRKGSSMMY